ncbi:MAG: P-loop NTPase, partial [Streptosporangiaceae bacterium]
MTPIQAPAAPLVSPATDRPAARIVLGLGDGQREHALMAGCADAGHVVVRRCLGAEELLAAARGDSSDLIVASANLHRLDATALAELLLPGRPVVLLADERLPLPAGHRAFVLPPGTETPAILRAIELTLSGQRPAAPEPSVAEDVPAPWDAGPAVSAGAVLDRVIVVTGGHGSAGRTTLAVNLAACLSGAGPVSLVDADLRGPSVGLALNLDRKRCLSMVAHAEPRTKREWARALDRELQPLSARSPLAMALCGAPKPEMAERIKPAFVDQLLPELHERYRYVVVD